MALRSSLTLAITTEGLRIYELVGFLDPRLDKTIDGIEYQNYPLQHCSIQSLEIVQTSSPVAEVKVIDF